MLSLFIAGAVVAAFYLLARRLIGGPSAKTGLLDAPQPVQLAAQRRGLAPAGGMPLVGAIPTPELCIAGLASAFAQMDEDGAVPQDAIHTSLMRHLKVCAQEAEDFLQIAPWIVAERGGPSPAFAELTRRLKQLDHGVAFDKLMRVLGDISAVGHRGMPSARQADALGALAAVFRTA